MTERLPFFRSAGAVAGALWIAAALGQPASAGPRVVLISIDGLRPDVIAADTTPSLAGLLAQGVSAENALNDLPSATLPNHATMLTGLVSDVHGLVLNVDLPGTIPQRTLFNYASDAGLRCGFFASKSKLGFLAPPDCVEAFDIGGNTDQLVDRFLVQLMPGGPDVLFLHIRDPDSVGHADNWLSVPYYEAVAKADALVGRIVEAIAADPQRPTYLLVTADHGGEGNNHFLNIPENRRIPWIVTGPGIRANQRVQSAVTTADTMPTLLWLLDLPIPGGLSGVARTEVRDASDSGGGLSPVAPVGLPCVLLSAPAALMLGGATLLRRRSGGARR